MTTSLKPGIMQDLRESTWRPHISTHARLFVDVAEAVQFAEESRERLRAAGKRRSVRVHPRGVAVDRLILPVWIVVQRDPQRATWDPQRAT